VIILTLDDIKLYLYNRNRIIKRDENTMNILGEINYLLHYENIFNTQRDNNYNT